MQFGQFGEFYAWHMHWIQIGRFNTPCHAFSYPFTPLFSSRTCIPFVTQFSHIFTHKLTHAVSSLSHARLSWQKFHMHEFLHCAKHSPFQKLYHPSLHSLASHILYLLRSNLGSKSEKLLHPFPFKCSLQEI